jgi:hypothetical protein
MVVLEFNTYGFMLPGLRTRLHFFLTSYFVLSFMKYNLVLHHSRQKRSKEQRLYSTLIKKPSSSTVLFYPAEYLDLDRV